MRSHLVASLAGAAGLAVGIAGAGCANVEVVDPASGGGGSETGGGGSPAEDTYDLAFVMGVYDAASNSVSDCRLHVLDLEDPTLTSRVVGNARPLAGGHRAELHWSPDGTMLTYTDEDGRGHLVRLDPSGATDELLSEDPPGDGVDTTTVWNPDSTLVATYQTEGSASDGLLVDVLQSPPEIVAHLGAFGGWPPPGFSPTGDRFAFTRDAGLFVVDTLSASPTPELLATGYNPLWSTDGSHLFYSTEDGLFWVAADGSSGPEQVASRGITGRSFVFPHGTGIAFENHFNGTEEQVIFVDLAQSPPTERILLTQAPSTQTWLAGSSTGRLAYGNWEMALLFDGGSAPPVPIELPASVEDCRDPAWSPDGRWLNLSCTATNGRVAVVVDTPDLVATSTRTPPERCHSFAPDSTGLLCTRSAPVSPSIPREELRWHPLDGQADVPITVHLDPFFGTELVSMAFRPGGHDLAYHMDTLVLEESDPPATNQLLLFEPELGASRVLAVGLCHDRIEWRPTAGSP
jgi:Tol biopolymer transport system component